MHSSLLLNGNILAARTFITHLVASLPTSIREKGELIPVGDKDEVLMVSDPLINFSQLAVVTCQRAKGDQSKVLRESWVRLCGTYQSQVTVLAQPEIRGVRNRHCSFLASL